LINEKNVRRMKAIQGKEHKIKLLTRAKQALEDAQVKFGHTKYSERIANLEGKIKRLQEDNENTQIKIDLQEQVILQENIFEALKDAGAKEISLEVGKSDDSEIKLEI
jgi:molybdopterin-binding protein